VLPRILRIGNQRPQRGIPDGETAERGDFCHWSLPC
jgi:hypothetical protein